MRGAPAALLLSVLLSAGAGGGANASVPAAADPCPPFGWLRRRREPN